MNKRIRNVLATVFGAVALTTAMSGCVLHDYRDYDGGRHGGWERDGGRDGGRRDDRHHDGRHDGDRRDDYRYRGDRGR